MRPAAPAGGSDAPVALSRAIRFVDLRRQGGFTLAIFQQALSICAGFFSASFLEPQPQARIGLVSMLA